MSSNNQLIIMKVKNEFCVFHDLCVDNDFEPSKDTLLKKEDTLEKAIRFANEYCNEYPYVEYGYYIDDSCLEEKK